MNKKKVLIAFILSILFFVGLLAVYKYLLPRTVKKDIPLISFIIPRKEVVGFLPYWLTAKAQSDYSKYITTLTYFSLTVDKDGTIKKFTNPGESEPGYLSLKNGKIDPFLNSAKAKGEDLSLAVFNGNDNDIGEILSDPVTSANNLTGDVIPIMQQYGFTDLNLDIEQTGDASPAARTKFVEFVRQIKENLNSSKAGTLSIDTTAISFVKDTNLVTPSALAPVADKIIIMAYDFHSGASFVTGPVAPGTGAGSVSEFDTNSAVAEAVKSVPAEKLILGIPLYGYEWETIGSVPRSGVIPGTSLIISSQRADDLLSGCATCSAVFDTTDQENHIIYRTESGTYQQIFYPAKASTQFKVDLANKYALGGIAVWALGYEDKTILEPLSLYHN